ncbi:MAG: outer membrane lipoprotein-sorting protein, partial [Spirochaetales bacterium]|nr:outer membrane lipoprotein-sorting protein [Spirochaetales bacterium]
MKKRVALLLTLLFVTGLLWGQNAEEIMKRSRNRIEAKTVSTRARMVISAKDGSSTERLVDQYSSTEKEITKTVVVFQKPASVAGTRFLTIENPGKAADQWIYLPSLGKVRRIAASEGSASFMGTDLSYDDLSSADRDPDLDSY